MRANVRRAIPGLLFALLVIPAVVAWSQGRGTPPRRATPPNFAPGEVNGVFFADLFAEGGPLVGERPAAGNVSAAPVVAANGGGAAGGGGGGNVASGVAGSGWGEIISSSTIEDEIKALNQEVVKTVTTPAKFAGTGHRQARKQFSLLAMLFAIVGEYEGDVRWKKDAPTLRDGFARAAANTKAGGNIQVYNEAKLRRDDLGDVVRGSSLSTQGGEPKANWEKVIARSPLMRILEERSAKRLQQLTSSESEFAKEPDRVLHEAELLVAMSEVLTKDGMDDADDDDYKAFALKMKKNAADVVDAVKLKNAEQARKAVGQIQLACDECHELYR